MEQIALDLLSFTVKVMTVALALGWLLSRLRPNAPTRGRLDVEDLNKKFTALGRQVARAGMGKSALKAEVKATRKADKAQSAKGVDTEPRVFVLDFRGDVRAMAVEALRQEVTAILQGSRPGDEVLVRLHSPGGAVTGYGLAADQLSRFTEAGLKLTVAVDQVAASGGYLMAVCADHIIAAPFAVVGSIGVVAMVPNLRRFLARHDVDVEQLTAGEHKRTLSVLGENTDEGRAQFQRDLEAIHGQFKEHVLKHRPTLAIDEVATGGHWTAANARALGLVDELITSDAWLLRRAQERAHLFGVKWTPVQPLSRRLRLGVEALVAGVTDNLLRARSTTPEL